MVFHFICVEEGDNEDKLRRLYVRRQKEDLTILSPFNGGYSILCICLGTMSDICDICHLIKKQLREGFDAIVRAQIMEARN